MSSAGREFKRWSPDDLVPSSRSGKDGRKSADTKSRAGTEGISADEGDETVSLYEKSKLIEQVEEEARKSGYEAGYAEGLAQASKEMAPIREAWLSWADQVPRFESARLQSSLPSLVSLLSKAFDRVMGEGRANPESIRGLLERMLGEYASGREAELRICDAEFHLLAAFDPDFQQDLARRGVKLLIGGDLLEGQVELRFPDRIVSFDPETATESFRRTLSRANPGPVPMKPSQNDKDEDHENRS